MKPIIHRFTIILLLVTILSLPHTVYAQDDGTQKPQHVDLVAECARKQFALYQRNHNGNLPQGAELDRILDLCLLQAEIIPLYLQTGQQVGTIIAPIANVVVPRWHNVTHPWLSKKGGQ